MGPANGGQQIEVRAAIQILLLPDGSISVNGPVADVTLMFGLLERAKDAVRDWHAQQARSSISVVPALPDSMLRSPKG